MAILGNTTLLSGESYGNFTVGGTLTTQKIVAPDPDAENSTSPNGIVFCSNGTLFDVNAEITSRFGSSVGQSDIPVYVKDGKITACNIYDGGADKGGVLTVYLPSDGTIGLTVNVPQLLRREDSSGNTGQIRMEYNTSSNVWEFGFESKNSKSVRTYSNGGFFESSDKRKKTNFRELDLNKCYEMIEKCQTVLFDWKDGSGKDQMGVIAQEVEEFFPEIVSTDEKGYKSVDYAKLAVVCMRVLKDLIDKVNGHRI